MISPTGTLAQLPSAEQMLESQVDRLVELNQDPPGIMATPESGDNSRALRQHSPQNPKFESLSQALSHVMGTPLEVAGRPTSSLDSLGGGIPALLKKLLKRIWADEYIDFSELPPAKGRQRNMPHHLEGRVLLIHWQELESQKRPITDFATWAQWFAIYTTALLQKQPERAADLMAYLLQTANNAKNFKWPAWLVYDQNFHQRMPDTQDIVWANRAWNIRGGFPGAEKISGSLV